MMPSYYATVSIKLCPAVGNDEYIILRNFNGRSMSGFQVKNGGLREQPPSPTPGRGQYSMWSLVQPSLGPAGFTL